MRQKRKNPEPLGTAAGLGKVTSRDANDPEISIPDNDSNQARIPDRLDLGRFLSAMYRYADPASYLSLRAFDDSRDSAPPLFVEAHRLDDPKLLDQIFSRASEAANHRVPHVFAPVVATFRDAKSGVTKNLANGLALSVECDANAVSARQLLSDILGVSPTIVVASGGLWKNPNSDELESKLHLHWRLKTPTRVAADHEMLRELRALATRIVGGDATGISVVHPFRWPGSWHRKGAPTLARIQSFAETEIGLVEALALLRSAYELLEQSGGGTNVRTSARTKTGGGEYRAADPRDVTEALAMIPNRDLPWSEWNRIGMATWLASEGQAFKAFDDWSRKSTKYDADETERRWAHYSTSPPDHIGVKTLFYLARQARPGWRAPSEQHAQITHFEAPDDKCSKSTRADFTSTSADTIALLATLSRIDYDQVRVREAERLGIRVSTLDAEVERRRTTGDKSDGAGQPLAFRVPEPWPDPIDGAELLAELIRVINEHVKLTSDSALAVALWILHAHGLAASFISPRLAITSPEKRCGKTTLLRIIEALTPKALSASNITAAALFRTVEKIRPTLLIDEADTFLSENEELRGIINSGHAEDGRVIRLVGDQHEPRTFSTFCPTAIAAIGSIPGTINDRSIGVTMRRKRRDEVVVRFRGDRQAHLQELSRKAARWIDDNLATLRRSDPVVPPELHDRAAENWRPLLAIADLAARDCSARAHRAALALSGASAGEGDTQSTLLLSDIRDLFKARQVDRLKSEELTTSLSALLDRPWPVFERGRPISPTSIARLLKPYGIIPGTIRTGDETARGYRRDAFEDAFSRYLPSGVDTPTQT